MSWLTASELQQAVDCYTYNNGKDDIRQQFAGIYPHDRLPPSLTFLLNSERGQNRLPLTLIINTDSHNLPGRHWIAIYIDVNRRGEVFDTLTTPISSHVSRFMNRLCRQWVHNRLIYQHPLSAYCGVYVLFYVLQRSYYNSLKNFCQANFSSSLVKNEHFIHSFYKHHILPCIPQRRRCQQPTATLY